jgi:CBS domain-containing protein
MTISASDVMTKNVVTVEPSLPAVELERLLDRERISGAPVVEGGRLVGVVSRADLGRAQTDASDRADALLDYYRDAGGGSPALSEHARLAGARSESVRVRDLMTAELVTVTPDQPVGAVAKTLVARGIHRVLVVEKGTLRGVISSLDIVRLVGEGRLVEAGPSSR